MSVRLSPNDRHSIQYPSVLGMGMNGRCSIPYSFIESGVVRVRCVERRVIRSVTVSLSNLAIGKGFAAVRRLICCYMRRYLLFNVLLLLTLPVMGQSQQFVEIQEGTLPLVLSAPHGGYLVPDSLADRSCASCVTIRDLRTQEWARALAHAIESRTGKSPWLVINLLDRIKLDPNRDILTAADGDPYAEAAWVAYHEALETASSAMERRFGGGLLLDLHGHGHEELRFELGYLLSAAKLREPDAAFNLLRSQSSIRWLVEQRGVLLNDVVRGNESFGAYLERSGVAATPSDRDPAPRSGQSYFSGGFITARHGSRDGGRVDAIQVEAHYQGARDSIVHVQRLAEDVADAVIAFMQQWYSNMLGTSVDAKARSPEACLFQRGAWVELKYGCPADTVELFDVLGRRAAIFQVHPGQRQHLPGLSRGIYLARGMTSGTTVTVLL